MHYAVAGGWFLDRKDWSKFDRAMIGIVRRFGYPTAMTCGHMPGCETIATEWAKIMLVPVVSVIDEVMPLDRAQLFFDHKPQMLLMFPSGSPANTVLQNFLAQRGVPVVEVSV